MTMRSEGAEKSQWQFREDSTKPKLTVSGVRAKLDALKIKKRTLRAEKGPLKDKEGHLKRELAKNKAVMSGIGMREWIACVLGRNEVSSRAIRLDFAAGLRDISMDEEEAEDDEEDGEDDEIDEDLEGAIVLREGSQSLPVFCVSAKGYHKLIGGMEGEKIAACFDSLDETGIPGLQDHARKHGNDKMLASYHVYNDAVKRLLT